MTIAETLLAQVEREIPATRRMVERVPDGVSEWKPHPKSMEMGYLSLLVATMFGWIATMVNEDHLDLAAGARPGAMTAAQRIDAFASAVASARRALSGATDEQMLKPWQLRHGDRVLDEKPRHIMIVDTISHLAHHRGQLSVYLRLQDQPLPSIYGPTADESWS
jgi:uncharacterized damage-inducible protein DinB